MKLYIFGQRLLKGLLIFIITFIVLIILLIIVAKKTDKPATQPSPQISSSATTSAPQIPSTPVPSKLDSKIIQKSPSKSNQSAIQVENKTANQSLTSGALDPTISSAIKLKIISYEMPAQNGKWQICIINRINSLDNFQLLSFLNWLNSLSPHSSEISQLTGIAKKMNCPSPVEKVIPAKTEIIKSWNGAGAKTLETLTNVPTPWMLTGSWTQKESIGEPYAETPYGVWNCESSFCSLLADGFWDGRTSGNFYGDSDSGLTTNAQNFYLKIVPNPSDSTASWSIQLKKVIELAKTIIE